MTDYCYPVVGEEANLPMYLLGAGARDQEFHFIREDGYPNYQITAKIRLSVRAMRFTFLRMSRTNTSRQKISGRHTG